MIERDRVRAGGTTIEYEVRRSKRRKKTFQITVDGHIVRVAVPWNTKTREVREFVRGHAPWISRSLADLAPPEESRTEPERDSVRVGDTIIEYEVRRSKQRKKSLQISVERGVVSVAVPSVAKSEAIRRAVRDRAAWIINKLSQAPPEGLRKHFVNGESMPYVGDDIPITVRFADVPAPEIRFEDGRFSVALPPNLKGKRRYEVMRGAFVEWYAERAFERVTECVDRWWPKLGRGEKSQVLIRNQRRRWGSCASDGTIRINWRIIMLEPALIEYIVVHELAHLTVRNHSPDFKALVASALPDFRDRQKRLGQTEGILPL